MSADSRRTRLGVFRKINWRWIFFGIIFVFVAVWAFYINMDVTDYSANKFTQAIDINNSDLKINWGKYQNIDINLPEIPTITESGTYHITGTLLGAPIVVDAGIGEVRLILDNVTIDNPTGPAILCDNAEDLVIELIGENILRDGSVYQNYDKDVASTIYANSDLFFAGTGELIIDAKSQNAITSKDDIKFSDGTYRINAANEAIHGKNSVYVLGGNFIINSVSHAVEVTNDIDYKKGFILVENGNLDITSASGKGLKSTKNILIYGGDFTISTFDDAIHSDNYIGIIGGNIKIDSGDDAIHSSRELIVDGGNINVEKSYEGLESRVVTINNGQINLHTLDDGINAGDSTSELKTDESCILSINGGEIYINSAGDGVDSNGYVFFNGGKTVIDGPVNDDNGALDSGTGINIQDGEVIAVGSSGMASNLGEDSGICNLNIYFNNIQSPGTKIEIKNSQNETILSHISAKSFNNLTAGSDKLTLGETYTIYLNDKKYDNFIISSTTTTIK